MTLLSVALLGGFVWVGMRGEADLATFCVGVVLALAAGQLVGLRWRVRFSPRRWAVGGGLVARLALRFLGELAIANLRQLRLVLGPTIRVRPRWEQWTTKLENPASRVALGVLISLTPGTVTAELVGKRYVIHVLDAEPDEDPVARIRDRFESVLLRLEAL